MAPDIKVCPEGKVYNEVTKRCNKIKVAISVLRKYALKARFTMK